MSTSPAAPGSRIAEDLELALRAVREAGAVVLPDFGREQEVSHKTPDQPLTAADLAADRILRAVLCGGRPEYGWLSEETADTPDRLALPRVWIVDPIDGTRSFIAGRPEFAISVGLAERGAVVVGVVYNPATAEVFWAVRGGGAHAGRLPIVAPPEPDHAAAEVLNLLRDGAPLSVTTREQEDQAVLLASRSEIAAGEFDPFHGGWRIHPTGSTAYKLAKIAAGEADVFLSRGPKSEWDVCAGCLLVEEAGGRVTDLDGAALEYNRADPYVHGILASNGRLHDHVLGAVSKLPPPPRLRRKDDPLHPGQERKEG